MATFVLVHGGGHGGWCYAKVAGLLRAAGHEVFTPTLTGTGERRHLVRADTDLSTHITDVVNLLFFEALTDVVLVGHSYGGMVITGVADRASGRIRELVFLDAAHPEDGQSLLDVAPLSMAFARSTSRMVDGVELAMWPDETMVAAMGASDPDDIAMLRQRMTPHPWACFAEPLRLADIGALAAIPRTNINCTASLTSSTPADRQRALAGHRNFEIDTGHDLMITEARAVADMLLAVVA